uniref:Apple domain-containing protein n=1 Tax=Meloidogyne javanica TaxID=6303 RepID=A0A915LV63_MELJA
MLTLIKAKSSNCFYLPSIALNGGTYDEFNAPEIKQCCIACARDPCCIAYTFDEENHCCFMKSAISNSFKNTGMTSGLKANTHHGLGAFLKNIKIHGGTASVKVNLPNNEDCMQYCT